MEFIPTNKLLGQHWLNDEFSLETIASSAGIGPADTVVEIGPGPGTLTKVLTSRAKKVIAIELDEALAHALPRRVKADNLEVLRQDVLKFDWSEIEGDYKLVANIPYYLTSNLIRVISEAAHPPVRASLLLQKEVAERMAAAPGQLSILGVSAQHYWEVSLGLEVPKKLFIPPPKVDSQVVMLKRRSVEELKKIDDKNLFRIVKAGFSNKRKTLLNSLSAGLRLDKSVVSEICKRVDIDPGRRAQTLSLDEWYKLAEQITT
jgi:16S rRNA (adenine1518-N6/adenine1519-N6)-dimethyltransferase